MHIRPSHLIKNFRWFVWHVLLELGLQHVEMYKLYFWETIKLSYTGL